MVIKNLNCLIFGHLTKFRCLLGLLVFCSSLKAEVGRSPASFSPDDDVIVVPVVVEQGYIDSLVKDEHGNLKPRVYDMKYTMDLWQEQNEFITNWSLQNTGYTLPDEAQKESFFRRRFFRYLTKKGGEPLKHDLKEWWERSGETQTEVDAVANEDIVESITDKKVESKEVVKVSSRVKLKFKPYLNKSRFILQNPYLDAEYNIGYNGRSDINISKGYSTGTQFGVNYQFRSKFMVAFVQQQLVENISLRISSIDNANAENPAERKNNTTMLIYSKGF